MFKRTTLALALLITSPAQADSPMLEFAGAAGKLYAYSAACKVILPNSQDSTEWEQADDIMFQLNTYLEQIGAYEAVGMDTSGIERQMAEFRDRPKWQRLEACRAMLNKGIKAYQRASTRYMRLGKPPAIPPIFLERVN